MQNINDTRYSILDTRYSIFLILLIGLTFSGAVLSDWFLSDDKRCKLSYVQLDLNTGIEKTVKYNYTI
jgi:hypothetical protein